LSPGEHPWTDARVPPEGAVHGTNLLPVRLDEAVDRLRSRLRTAEREVIAELPRDSLSDLHQRLRPALNALLGLDRTNRPLLDALGTQDPDEASFRVIEALWRDLKRQR
jgi:hypothetical protein